MNGISKQPLLSICIPTYNRADFLQGALDNIVSDESFDSRVEVIISDNTSTDNTQIIGEKYASQYENIFYFRNAENLKDENFFLALSRAHGQYVRLFNDTLRLRPSSLGKMLKLISETSDKYLLFFYQNIDFTYSNTMIEVKGVKKFLSSNSYFVTWIGNFGTWRKNLDQIVDPQACVRLSLAQVDWTFLLVSQAKRCFIYYDCYFDSIVPHRKGGYNIFTVFLTNYLKIVRTYIPFSFVYEREKYRLFRHFILTWCCILFFTKDPSFLFDTKSSFSLLLKNYWYYPYFYLGLVGGYLKFYMKKL